jgi:hypothetical protein
MVVQIAGELVTTPDNRNPRNLEPGGLSQMLKNVK